MFALFGGFGLFIDIVLDLLLTLLLPLLDLSSIVFALVFVQTLALELFLDLSDFLLYLFTEFGFLFLLRLGLRDLIRSHVILLAVKV